MTDSPFILAPMAGYTDYVFRDICLSYGAGLTYTEMVSAEGIARNSKNTLTLMKRGENEKKLAVQIFAPDEKTVLRCIPNLLKAQPDIIDLNCGCPVPKIIKTGCGSALLKTPDVIGRIVHVLKSETNLPVSVKIRAGWDNNSINFLQTSDFAFNNGADAVTLHCRTKSQLYMPYANHSYLKQLKETFPEKIIIGSGDIFTAEDAVRVLNETNANKIMIARGAIGNPFIFSRAQALLKGITTPEPDILEIKQTVLQHLSGLINSYGEEKGCKEMRKHIPHYFKGIPDSNKIKHKCYNALTYSEYEEILNSL